VAAGQVAERRVCSVLFCDVVGFTPLAEARDPEAVRELLSEYFAVARTVVGRYGGVVEKFIGDAVMAVWGTPAATEGDAKRAVRAALALVAAVGELGAEAGVPGLAARAGVVTGEVAVNLGAVGEGMVAGDAVNTASRVQAAAGAGQVLTDAATQRLAGSAIGFADAGEHALKGKAEAVRLWRAIRVLSGIGAVLATAHGRRSYGRSRADRSGCRLISSTLPPYRRAPSPVSNETDATFMSSASPTTLVSPRAASTVNAWPSSALATPRRRYLPSIAIRPRRGPARLRQIRTSPAYSPLARSTATR
jgi:class 3 adenylate cyclase